MWTRKPEAQRRRAQQRWPIDCLQRRKGAHRLVSGQKCAHARLLILTARGHHAPVIDTYSNIEEPFVQAGKVEIKKPLKRHGCPALSPCWVTKRRYPETNRHDRCPPATAHIPLRLECCAGRPIRDAEAGVARALRKGRWRAPPRIATPGRADSAARRRQMFSRPDACARASARPQRNDERRAPSVQRPPVCSPALPACRATD